MVRKALLLSSTEYRSELKICVFSISPGKRLHRVDFQLLLYLCDYHNYCVSRVLACWAQDIYVVNHFLTALQAKSSYFSEPILVIASQTTRADIRFGS